jgi:phage terminase large subunit
MLSTTSPTTSWNAAIEASKQRRARILDCLQQNPQKQPEELQWCRRRIVHWMKNWAWTTDSRESLTDPILPFDPFPKQEEFLDWIKERETTRTSGLVEKSRDMGATWLCAAYAVHGWLFRRGFACGFGSMKLELVDRKGDPKCIFEKIRFLVERLPPWMKPLGYDPDKHSKEGVLINPENGSTITGEGGDDIGRGNRTSCFFVDEAARLVHPLLADRALGETTNCQIDISTPNGPGNPFAQKRFSGLVPVFQLHWRDDPRKGQEWYDAKKNGRYANDPVGLAQEIDIDYNASIEGVVIPGKWVRASVDLNLPPGELIVAGLDIAEYGVDRNVLMRRSGPKVLPPEDWRQCNTADTAKRARNAARDGGAKLLSYDVVGMGASIRGEWETLARTESLGFEAQAVNGQDQCSRTRWEDGRTSREKFHNLRAECWFLMRRRFEKTFEVVVEGKSHPSEEMISIPNHPQLIAELSLPLQEFTEGGRIKVESKRQMRGRGIKSPNFADALALTFAPVAVVDYNVRTIAMTSDTTAPREIEPVTMEIKWPGIRYFAQIGQFQVWCLAPVTGERIAGPAFHTQSEGAYSFKLLHQLLNWPPVTFDDPDKLTPEQKADVLEKTKKFIEDRGLKPIPRPEPPVPDKKEKATK